MAPHLAPEVSRLVERTADLPLGLAFVQQAPLESVAVTLGVHPRIVERARACLDHPRERTLLVQAYERAVEQRRLEPARTDGHSAAPPPPRGPVEIVREAERRERGLDLLLRTPLETAAVVYEVHPEVVLGAREILAQRGIASDPGEE